MVLRIKFDESKGLTTILCKAEGFFRKHGSTSRVALKKEASILIGQSDGARFRNTESVI